MSVKSNVIRALLIFVAVIAVGAVAIVVSVERYHVRHRAEHRERLQQILASHPTESQLYQILGSPWHQGSTDEAVSLARQHWAAPSFSISADLAQRAPRALIYLVSDIVYLVLIDPSGTMADFVLLNN
jgi:hypothetical protein